MQVKLRRSRRAFNYHLGALLEIAVIPEELLAQLYQTPLDDEPWLGFLQVLREEYQAVAGSIALQLPEPGHPGFDVADSEWDVGVLRAHHSRHFADNPFRYESMVPGKVYRWSDFVSPEVFHASRYYQEFCRPVGFEYALCQGAEAEGIKAWLSIARTARHGDFNTAETTRFLALAPHLRRALALYGRIHRSEDSRAAYETAMEQLAIGTLLLDRNGRVISTSAAAQAILDRRDSLQVRNQHLHATTTALDAALQRHLQQVLHGESLAEAIAIPRNDTQLGLLLRAFPGQDKGDRPAAIVYLSDPANQPLIPDGLVAKLFGLTPAESRLAVLLTDGLSIAEAAARLRVSEGTARSYCKRIFAKTGISRQAELVRLILKSVAMLGRL